MFNKKTEQLQEFLGTFLPRNIWSKASSSCVEPGWLMVHWRGHVYSSYRPTTLETDTWASQKSDVQQLVHRCRYLFRYTLVGNACFPWEWSWILLRHWWFIVCWGFAEYGWVALFCYGLKVWKSLWAVFCLYISSWPRNVNVGFVPSKKVLNGTLAIIITWWSHHTGPNGMQVKLPKTPWMRRLGWVGVRFGRGLHDFGIEWWLFRVLCSASFAMKRMKGKGNCWFVEDWLKLYIHIVSRTHAHTHAHSKSFGQLNLPQDVGFVCSRRHRCSLVCLDCEALLLPSAPEVSTNASLSDQVFSRQTSQLVKLMWLLYCFLSATCNNLYFTCFVSEVRQFRWSGIGRDSKSLEAAGRTPTVDSCEVCWCEILEMRWNICEDPVMTSFRWGLLVTDPELRLSAKEALQCWSLKCFVGNKVKDDPITCDKTSIYFTTNINKPYQNLPSLTTFSIVQWCIDACMMWDVRSLAWRYLDLRWCKVYRGRAVICGENVRKSEWKKNG